MALPLIPFAVGVAVGAVAVFALKGTPAGAAIDRRARRLADEVGDRLSQALSREGGLVREHYPEAPSDRPDAPADRPRGSSRPSDGAARDPG
jgi:hypothetical protein